MTGSAEPFPTFVSTVDPSDDDFEDLLEDDVPNSDLNRAWFDEIAKMIKARTKQNRKAKRRARI